MRLDPAGQIAGLPTPAHVCALLPEATEQLRQIHEATARAEGGRVEQSGRAIVALLRDGFVSGGTGGVANYVESEGGGTLTIRHAPWEALSILGLVTMDIGAAGEGAR